MHDACGTPDKVRFSSIRSAAQAAVEQFEVHGRSQRIYADAGHFHLTSDCDDLSDEVLARLKEAAR